MNIFKEYIKYIFKAKGRHGTHSPFVYSFVNECLKTNMDNNFLLERKKLFNYLKNNNKIIEITDFGEGSKKLSNKRIISKIFRFNSSKGKFGKLLYKIAHYYQPENILEMGTSLGVGTFQLAKGNEKAKVISIEACKTINSVAKETISTTSAKNIDLIQATFDDFFKVLPKNSFDLVFVDGHHNGNALLRYLEELKAITHNDTIFIIDDIRWSDDMFEAWNQIVQNKEYNLTMDLFRMGIIIPRKQQMKEHFVIRY